MIQEIAYQLSFIKNKELRNKILLQIVYDLAVFRSTPKEDQELRSVDNIIKREQANCTQYTTIISSILMLMNEPHLLQLIDQTGKGFDHIYVIIDGHKLDATLGQPINDTAEFNTRKKESTFNYNLDYYRKSNLLIK